MWGAEMTDAKATLAEEEFGWVIERGDSSPSSPTYWSGPDYWSQDHMDAVRFSRKQDAERVACRLHGGHHRICEHGWCNNPTPPAVEAGRKFTIPDFDRAVESLTRSGLPISVAVAEEIAAEFAAIRREAAASPTELEKELTAALRDLLYKPMNSDAHRKADAVLAKATERGL